MTRSHLGLILTMLMFLPLAIAAFAPAGWVMLFAIALMLVLQLAAMACFYTDAQDDAKPH